MIRVLRGDPLANAPDSHEPGILSAEEFATWEAVFVSLRARGIPLTGEHEAELLAHDDTQFVHSELVNSGVAVYTCAVLYDVRVVQ